MLGNKTLLSLCILSLTLNIGVLLKDFLTANKADQAEIDAHLLNSKFSKKVEVVKKQIQKKGNKNVLEVSLKAELISKAGEEYKLVVENSKLKPRILSRSGKNKISLKNRFEIEEKSCESISEGSLRKCIYMISAKKILNDKEFFLIGRTNLRLVNTNKNFQILLTQDEETLESQKLYLKVENEAPEIANPFRVAKKKAFKKKKRKKILAKKKKVSRKIANIRVQPKIFDGIYCHIKVFNPPHQEKLSDQKDQTMLFDDPEECREKAIRLSKRHCDDSLMGEIDYQWSLKDKQGKSIKVLNHESSYIQCDQPIKKADSIQAKR